MPIIPSIVEKTSLWVRSSDIYSRLLEDRVIFLWGEINDEIAQLIIAQLLYLEMKNPKKDIIMYINSPGWVVSSGLAIYDTMQYLKCDVATICLWMAASMGSLLLTAGTKGKRYALPHSEVMIHQPLGGTQWQASDIAIHAEHILNLRDSLNKILSKHTGQTIKKIEKDVDRDNYLTAKEAKDYGLIDEIITSRK